MSRLTAEFHGNAYKVYDCFTYDGEECIDLRLSLLREKVDYFVIVESNITFSGLKKDYSFDVSRFAAYGDKIRYYKLDAAEFSHCQNEWERERFQRNALARGIFDAKADDVVIISDVDEILLPEKIRSIAPGTYHRFQQFVFYFYCDYVCISQPLMDKVVAMRGDFALKNTFEELRNFGDICKGVKEIMVPASGWHFSYLGGVDAVIKKLSRFSHQEYNVERYRNRDFLMKNIDRGYDIYDRDMRWGRVTGWDLGNRILADWFQARPVMKSPASIVSYRTLDKVIDGHVNRKRLDHQIRRAWWRFIKRLSTMRS